MFFLGSLHFLYMLSIEMLMTSRQHNVGGDGSEGAGGPGAKGADGAADSAVPAAADTDDAADATAAADDAAAAGTDELADEPDGSVFSTGESSCSSFLLVVDVVTVHSEPGDTSHRAQHEHRPEHEPR
jgi:hypothetical protein